jgi:hypothetical protein
MDEKARKSVQVGPVEDLVQDLLDATAESVTETKRALTNSRALLDRRAGKVRLSSDTQPDGASPAPGADAPRSDI